MKFLKFNGGGAEARPGSDRRRGRFVVAGFRTESYGITGCNFVVSDFLKAVRRRATPARESTNPRRTSGMRTRSSAAWPISQHSSPLGTTRSRLAGRRRCGRATGQAR